MANEQPQRVARTGKGFHQNGWGENAGLSPLARDLRNRPEYALAKGKAISDALIAFVAELNARPDLADEEDETSLLTE